MDSKKALITGISGQDGYYTVKLLLSKNYEIFGILRRKQESSYGNLMNLPESDLNKITFFEGDINDMSFIMNVIKSIKPDEVYHLAGQTFLKYSFSNPEITFQTNFIATYYLLESIKVFSKDTKFFFTSSSEVFGNSLDKTQTISTKFNPINPYGISKAIAFHLVKMYRDVYGIFAVNGICFNHESEFRGPEFVTRKISMFVANYSKTLQGFLEMGNLDATRAWGHSEDFVEGFWLSLQQSKAKDYIFAHEETNSIRDFIQEAFKVIGREIKFMGEGLNEVGIDCSNQHIVLRIHQDMMRPKDIYHSHGESSITKKELNWNPKVKIHDLVRRMVLNDIRLIEKKKKNSGFSPKL